MLLQILASTIVLATLGEQNYEIWAIHNKLEILHLVTVAIACQPTKL